MTLHLPHWHTGNNQSVRSSVPVVHRWLGPENMTFLEVASMVAAWWIMAFLCSDHLENEMSTVTKSEKVGDGRADGSVLELQVASCSVVGLRTSQRLCMVLLHHLINTVHRLISG